MSTIDYNQISLIYDDVRTADVALLNCFLQEIELDPSTTVLDIGCGTGNYADLIQRLTQAQVYGVEPSAGMRDKAQQKNEALIIKTGDSEHIPFADNLFNFIYMTDVIHHVPDIDTMFVEIYRVLKDKSKLCIITQSHKQIEQRPIVQFFSETATVDKARYPDVTEIVERAIAKNLNFTKTVILGEADPLELDQEFLTLVKNKGYSMLHLIANGSYIQGVKQLEEVLASGSVSAKSAGETLVWFQKG